MAEASGSSPLIDLERWLTEATDAGLAHPWSCVFITSSASARPSSRTVTLKRIEDHELLFTSALWTRKVADLRENPQVAIAFHWPALGRQVQVEGIASEGDRTIAEELFAERGRDHQLQAHVSRQGEEIESLETLRERHSGLESELAGKDVPCPEDWGVIRVRPERVEFWQEAPDRLHERVEHYRREAAWESRLVAP